MTTPTHPKCGPISKLLLTPCRRPGLSRKVRTPLQQTSPHYQPLNIVKIEPDNFSHVKPELSSLIIPTEPKDSSKNVKTDSVTLQNCSKEIKKSVERDKVRGTGSNNIVSNEESVPQTTNISKETGSLSSQNNKRVHKFGQKKCENVNDSEIFEDINCELKQNVKRQLKVIATSIEKHHDSKSKSVEKKEVKPLNIVKIELEKFDRIKPDSSCSIITTEAKDSSKNEKINSRILQYSPKEIKKSVERDKVRGTGSNIISNEESVLQTTNGKMVKLSKSNDIISKETEHVKGSEILKDVNCEIKQNKLKVLVTDIEKLSENINPNSHIDSKCKSNEKKEVKPLNIVKIKLEKYDRIKLDSTCSIITTEVKDSSKNEKINSRILQNSSKEIKKSVECDKVRGTGSNIISNEENVPQTTNQKIIRKETEHLKGSEILKDVNCEIKQNKLKVLVTDIEKFPENVNPNSHIDSQCKSNEKKEVKPKKFLKRLSMKRSTSNNDSISDLEDFPSPLESVELETNVLNGIVSKAKKPRINVEDVDISVDSITDIQHRIKVKKEKLRQLKQAATYKKIHNVDELEKEIDMWKNGCRRALDQLHQKLQSHGPISMERLVQKLNVPEDIIDNL